MFSPIIGLGFSGGGKKRNNIKEIIKTNVDNGGHEFFTGYNPDYWHTKFGFEVSPNGRFAEHEQVTSLDDLKLIVKEVHSYGKKIMGNLNAWYYTDVVENEIKKIIEDFLEADIDGFICGSLGILEYIDSISEGRYDKGYIINGKKIQINISTILAVYNKDAISFLLSEYPVGKVILSREVTLEEIDDITKSFPDLTFEVFMFGDFCRYNNGLCFAEHKYTDRDICTVVVNDLNIKKAINYNFREIIHDEKLTDLEKVEAFNNDYFDEFQLLSDFLEDNEINKLLDNYTEEDEITFLTELNKKIERIKSKYILYYDPLENINSINNKNLKLLIRSHNRLLEAGLLTDLDFLVYLKNELQLGLRYNLEKIKKSKGGEFDIVSEYKDKFYNRSDILSIFTAPFFDKIKNIDTVKFPTRGRDYTNVIHTIKNVIKDENKMEELLQFDNIFTRAHYDLKYLFNNDKKWFYKIRKDIHNKTLKNTK